MSMKIGQVIEFTYKNKVRRGQVESVHNWGIVVWVFGDGYKSFRYEKIQQLVEVA
jgi:hypothetical protein